MFSMALVYVGRTVLLPDGKNFYRDIDFFFKETFLQG